MHLSGLAIRAEYELRIDRDGQLPRPRRPVPDSQSLYAYRVLPFCMGGDKCQKRLFQGMTVVLELRVSLAVTRPIRVELPHRQRRGRPKDAAIFVANIDCLGRTVRNRFVVPGR